VQNSEHILQRVRATTSALLRASPRGAWQAKVPAKRRVRPGSLSRRRVGRRRTGALGKKTGTLGEEDGNNPPLVLAKRDRACLNYASLTSTTTPRLILPPSCAIFRRPPPDPLYSRAGCTTLRLVR